MAFTRVTSRGHDCYLSPDFSDASDKLIAYAIVKIKASENLTLALEG